MACQLGNATRTVLHREELGYAVVFTEIERSTWIRNFSAGRLDCFYLCEIVSEWLFELPRYNLPKGLSLKYIHTRIYDTQGLIVERTFCTNDSVNRFTLVNSSISRAFENDSRDKWSDLYNGVKGSISRRSSGGWINEGIDNYRMGLFLKLDFHLDKHDPWKDPFPLLDDFDDSYESRYCV